MDSMITSCIKNVFYINLTPFQFSEYCILYLYATLQSNAIFHWYTTLLKMVTWNFFFSPQNNYASNFLFFNLQVYIFYISQFILCFINKFVVNCMINFSLFEKNNYAMVGIFSNYFHPVQIFVYKSYRPELYHRNQ